MSSKIPTDLLVPRGLNGLLDTYPDMSYGLGVLEGVTTENAGPTSGLPDGVVKADEDGLGDLDSFMKEGNCDMDLSFIDVEEDPYIQSLPEYADPDEDMVQIWSSREEPAVYAEFQKDLTAIPRIVEEEEADELMLNEAVFKAARMLTAGESLQACKEMAFASLGKHASELKEDFEYLESERGLLGNVYVLATAYPKLHNGGWKKHLKKAAPTARYLLIDLETEVGRKLASYESFHGLKVVTEIPYAGALDYYRPSLNAAGREVVGSDPRVALKNAFLQAPKREFNLGVRPVDVKPSERVSLEEAKDKFASAEKQESKIYTQRDQDESLALKQARKKIASLYRSGSISESELKALVRCKTSSELRLALARIKSSSLDTSNEYSGGENKLAHQQSLRNIESVPQKVARIESDRKKEQTKRVHKKVAQIKTAVSKGLRGEGLKRYIKQSLNEADLKIASPLLNPFLKKTQALFLKEADSKEYSGAIEHRHQEHRRAEHVEKITQQDRAISKFSRWVRKHMTEGVAGQTLTDIIRVKYAPSFLKSAEETLKSLREEHEGLSGHAYVDAEVYASKTGSTGCDKGALKHRSNQLKFVKAMDRCSSCAFANRLADGRSVCQKYNKRLASDVPVENPKEYQREMIRLANGSDADQTASYFNNYDASEYSLHNAALDGFGIEENTIESLGGIFFGGLEIDDE